MGLAYSACGISGFPFDFIKQFTPHGYTICVETGTYYGDTSIQLSKVFKKIYTIEASEKIFNETHKKLSAYSNIVSQFGNSQILLPRILAENKDSFFVFWLDAHYSGGDTFLSPCPLLEEISTINDLCKDPIIIIDDARFINMKYNDENRYAELQDFIPLLHNKNRYISCFDDKYIAVPQKFKDSLDRYTQVSALIDEKNISASQKRISMYFQKIFALLRR
ncbi:hypothetical protein [Desulfovibrio sp.]|uniref:hypothetical protein n=1 Tax=Desulfovibrio sp. TaxID=885 RepID=UPI003D0F280C